MQREYETPDGGSRGGQVSACRITFKFDLETGNLGGLIFRIDLINLSIDGLFGGGAVAPKAED